jgi:BNR/Asp-box repeat
MVTYSRKYADEVFSFLPVWRNKIFLNIKVVFQHLSEIWQYLAVGSSYCDISLLTSLGHSVRKMLAFIIGVFAICGPATALKGAVLTTKPYTYAADLNTSTLVARSLQNVLSSGSYEYTGFGAAESSMDITDDGVLIYAPAFANNRTGYATSKDDGKTWNMAVPSPNQPRMQPMFNIHDGRYFYWSSGAPGLHMSYSDDRGETWKKTGDHVIPLVQDWAKIVSGKPVRSLLTNASSILYLSAPSLISVPISGSLGPKFQLIAKSVDRGITWKLTKSAPTLNATRSGGACAALSPTVQNQEYIIWSNGLVRPNGTVMYGLRRCRSVSVAISDDEGDTWRFSDIPGSTVVPYTKGLAT